MPTLDELTGGNGGDSNQTRSLDELTGQQATSPVVPEGPGFMRRLGNAAGEGALNIIPSLANTAVQGVRGGYDLLNTYPSQLPGKLADVVRGAASAVTLGGYQPDTAGDPAREALQSLGSSGVAGLAGMGIGKLIGGIASPLLRALAGTGIGMAQGGASAAVQGGDIAQGMGNALGGQAVAVGLPAVGGAALRKIAGPANRVVEQNAANQGFNAERAATISRGEQTQARAHAELATASANLDSITNKIAINKGALQVVSPFAQTLAAPVTDKQAYSFIKAIRPEALPSIPLNNLQAKAQEIVNNMSGIPKPLQPAKVVGTAKALMPEDALNPTVGRGGDTVNLSELSDLQKQAYAPLLKLIESHNKVGGVALDKLVNFKTALNQLIDVTSPNARNLGKQLYHSFMDDVRETAKTSPAAEQFLKANTISLQNHTAADIADIATKNGTQIDKFERLTILPGQLKKAINKFNRKDGSNSLLEGLSTEARQRFEQTITDVFRVNREVSRAEESVAASKPSKPARKLPTGEELVSKHPPGLMLKTLGRTIGAAIGGAAASHLGGVGIMGGMYLGDKAGQAVVAKIPQMIFRAALTEPGTAFLRQLFADGAPKFGDQAKAIALQNFLQAQDFNNERKLRMQAAQ